MDDFQAARDIPEPPHPGDKVRIKDGPFRNLEGVVDAVFPAKGMVRVAVTIFGRVSPIDLEYAMIKRI